jgi:ribosomal protein L11 methyltransferase
MKKYFEARIPAADRAEDREMIIARLSVLGFEGFVEEDACVLAYLEEKKISLAELRAELSAEGYEGVEIKTIEDRNWNAEWESEYESVLIDEKILVRAPFHKAPAGIEYDIVIEPKMSFGTAHHETTYMMLSLITGLDVKGKSVLDMGSGTGVLAVLAAKIGATEIMAIDNDEWAYRNACDNVVLNNCPHILVIQGDASAVKNQKFDIIFANINRNILLEDIPVYAGALLKGGMLLMSGFYENDLGIIQKRAEAFGLRLSDTLVRNKWTAAVFISENADDKN